MKQRIGGVLVAVLGAVLLTSGLHGTGVSVGEDFPSCGLDPSTATVGETLDPCPTGTITFTENDTTSTGSMAAHAAGSHAAPATWRVSITTTCDTLSGTQPIVVEVPDGGSATSAPLEIYTTTADTQYCDYTYTETPVAGYTATFDPSGVSFDGNLRTANIPVALTNNSLLASTSTSTPPTTATGSVLPTVTSVAPPTSVARSSSSVAVLPTVTSTAPTLPFTGSNARVHASLVAGIGLLVLGLVMIVGSGHLRVRRRVRHH